MFKKRFSRIKGIPYWEQPREKLVRYGVQNLTDSELLAIILRVGNKRENVLELSRKILTKFNFQELSQISYNQIRKFRGINKAKACQILACFEIARRLATYKTNLIFIKKPKDVVNILAPYMRHLKKENFVGLYLNSRNRIIRREVVSMGTTECVVLHPKDVFAPAITDSATSVILVHNHPSGDPSPSRADIRITQELREASKILRIKFLDHIIIGNDSYYSFMEKGLL